MIDSQIDFFLAVDSTFKKPQQVSLTQLAVL